MFLSAAGPGTKAIAGSPAYYTQTANQIGAQAGSILATAMNPKNLYTDPPRLIENAAAPTLVPVTSNESLLSKVNTFLFGPDANATFTSAPYDVGAGISISQSPNISYAQPQVAVTSPLNNLIVPIGLGLLAILLLKKRR